jgi:UDP-2-acetamido-2-deoxy-ribo-hexuluronate aminotransferase
MTIPFVNLKGQYLAHKDEIDEAIHSVLDEGNFIMGEPVRLLESELSAYCGAKHCITCANGTDALQIAMMGIGIGPGDEVITTPFTFISTAETIKLLGAKPVFVDVDQRTFNIDAKKIEEKITSKTKAIIPVSLYGLTSDMDAINDIAKRAGKSLGHKVYVIEDAAQSFGATYKSKKSCNLSDIATTSFFPSKPLGCYGDGGAIFCNDDELAEIMSQIRVHGQEERYHHVRVGVNSRLDTIQAAILRVKLKYFDEEIAMRNDIAEMYNQCFEESKIHVPFVPEGYGHVYGQYTLRVKNRDEFVVKSNKAELPVGVYYPIPLHKQEAFLDEGADCPVSDVLSKEVVSLALGLYMSLSPIKERVESMLEITVA